MELTIFDSIIFGTLQPWQVGNQNEQTFSDLLRRAGRTVPVTVQELNNKNQILLRDHPTLYKPTTGKPDDVLPTSFYKLTLPNHFNATTEFYSILMQCFALQFMYELSETINKTTDQTEAYYIINSTLEKIKYLAAGAAKELQRQDFDSIPNYQAANNIEADETIKRNIHFILFSAKQITMQIFFEVQKRFEPHVKAIEAEPQFYLHTLKETAPQLSILVPSISLYAWDVDQFINSKDFSLDTAKKIQSELNSFSQQDAPLQNLQTALENFVFSNFFEIEVDGSNAAAFAEAVVSNNLFAEVKADIEKSVQRFDKGYKRYEVISSALDKITIAPSANTQSALTKLNKWLLQQQTLYTNLYNNKFPVEVDNTKADKAKTATKISFCFTGKEEKLKNVIIELCNKVQLLNEDKSSHTELISLLTNKNIQPGSTQIYLGCETVQFTYIIDKLKDYFTNLTPKEIGSTECFYSKKANLIKAQNLYSNKIDNPKDQSTIDNIINQLQ